MKVGKEKKEHREKTALNKWQLIALLVATILCFIGVYALFDLYQDWRSQNEFVDMARSIRLVVGKQIGGKKPGARKGEDAHTEESEQGTEGQILPQYQALYEQNSDMFGWLSIEGTILDYPVMYTPQEREKYLYLSFNGKSSDLGTPFIDESCSPDSDNLIIYGHNMRNGTMFREIMKYDSQDYWREHPTIHFDTLYEQGEYQVLSAFYDRVYYTYEDCFKFYRFIDAEDEAAFNQGVSNFKAKGIYDTGVSAKYGDSLITLVTCSYHEENGRFVVVACKSTDN